MIHQKKPNNLLNTALKITKRGCNNIKQINTCFKNLDSTNKFSNIRINSTYENNEIKNIKRRIKSTEFDNALSNGFKTLSGYEPTLSFTITPKAAQP